MKTIIFKKTYILAVIASMANVPASLADSYSGSLAASSLTVERTDLYGLTCPAGTATARAKVTNPNGSASDEIGVTVISPNGRANTVIALEGSPTSPTAVLAGGSGNYLISVHKSQTAFPVSYSIFLDCYTGGNSPAPVSGVQSALIQNQ